MWWWETQKPGAPVKIAKGDSHVSALAWSGDATLLAEESPSFAVAEWRVSPTSTQLGTHPSGAWVKGLAFTADARWLLIGSSDGLSAGEVGSAATRSFASGDRSIEDIAFDEDGALLVSTDRDGHLEAWGVRE